MDLFSLFISGFTSATLLPGSSEALFLYLLSRQEWNSGFLLIVVGAGNSLGGMTNWVIGMLIRSGFMQKKHALSEEKKSFIKAQQWLEQHGAPVLFFSFLPIIGDPLCLVAGLIRIHWLKALAYITLGKFTRYIVLLGLYQ
jgi:membrane protein YqaA with SNARE-associated domain